MGMRTNLLLKYARLLTDYCCSIKKGDRVLIRSSYLAEDLVLACQKEVLERGATCEFDISLPNIGKQKYEYSTKDALKMTPILYKHAVESFDVIISISAPFNLFELQGVNKNKLALSQKGLINVKSTMMERGKSGDLRWVICNYPTQSLADATKMSP
jgi:Leucyl aminopeptidase (aminopeptidase T)